MILCKDIKNLKLILKNHHKTDVIIFSSLKSIHTIEEISSLLKNNKHRKIDNIKKLKNLALKDIKVFFNLEIQQERNWHYSFKSKVYLAIKNNDSIFKIFIIKNYLSIYKYQNLIVYCDDSSLTKLIRNIFFNEKFSKIIFPSIYAWGRFFRTFLRTFINKTPKIKLINLFLTLKNLKYTVDSDYYYGGLSSFLENNKTAVFLYMSAGYKLSLPSYKNYFSLESFSKPLDVLKAFFWTLKECAALKHKYASKNNFFYTKLSNYLKLSEIIDGDFFYNCFLDITFNSILKKYKPRLIVYPFENRSWEKLLLKNAYKYKVPKIYGYQHSSITPRHFAFQDNNNLLRTIELPFKIITAGKFTYNWLKLKNPGMSKKLISGGSLRKVSGKINSPSNMGILVAISSNLTEATKVLNIINKVSSRINIRIIVRSHPTLNISHIYKSFKWNKFVNLSKNISLIDDLILSNIIIYTSSTVVIEGMQYGRIPIYLDIDDVPSGDPLMGNSIFKAKNEDDIIKVINDIQNMSQIKLGQIKNDIKSFSNHYLSDISENDFIKIINL